jgi:hypothetical protein
MTGEIKAARVLDKNMRNFSLIPALWNRPCPSMTGEIKKWRWK